MSEVVLAGRPLPLKVTNTPEVKNKIKKMVTSETDASESAYPLFRENSLQNKNKIISTISESSFSDELDHYDLKRKQLV